MLVNMMLNRNFVETERYCRCSWTIDFAMVLRNLQHASILNLSHDHDSEEAAR